MDHELQNKFRAALIEDYLKHAFDCLGLYDYYGKKYRSIEKQIEEMGRKRQACLDEIQKIGDSPDYHTVENRDKVKALKKDIENYEGQMKGVEGAFKTLWNNAVKFREEGVKTLEIVENFRDFKLKSIEEVEAEQQKAKEDLEHTIETAEQGSHD